MASTSDIQVEDAAKHDYLAANKAQWDEQSASYRSRGPGAVMAEQSAQVFLRAYPWREDTVAFDFACGPGLLSEAIAPRVKLMVGLDVSEKMVNEYNKTAAGLGLDSSRMRGQHIGELVGAPEELDNLKADAIICAQSFHHLGDVAATTAALAAHLKPGGKMLIIDIDASNGVFAKILDAKKHEHGGHHHHHHHHHVAHAGFTADELRGLLEGVPILGDVRVEKAWSMPLSTLKEKSGASGWDWLSSEEAKAEEAKGTTFDTLLATATRV